MTQLEHQIRELSPSVKDALYRRLLFAEDLAWLRDENKKGVVIGFEVVLNEQELSGFALIAIQRHTVIAYVSDRHEEPRLILFPSLDTLFDPGFELLDLTVVRKEFTDSTFNGTTSMRGRFGDMVKDLTPPERQVDISNTVLDQISSIIKTEEGSKVETKPVPPEPEKPKPVVSEPEKEPESEQEEGPPEGFIEDEPNDFEDYTEPGYDNYDEYEEYDEPEEFVQPEPEKQETRSDQLKSQTFETLNDLIDFAVTKLGVNRPLAVTLVNKAMQSKVSPEYRIELAVNIFCKLIDEDKI